MGPYQLRCSLVGHEKDVRALCPTDESNSSIISGSRDVTARIWSPNEHDNGFTEGNILSGHSGFVVSVCLLPGSEAHPRGLIATGSNDKMIHVYSFDSPMPIYKLAGHDDTVCCLSAGKFGTMISASWDKTAKVWLKDRCVMTLTGHELAVWCVLVMPKDGYMITGSADKLIKVWRAGKCEHTLKGHEDCVRGLAVVDDREFLSCSNDSSVRRWGIGGHVLQVYYSHMNYVYSIATLPNSTDFVTVSEDRSLKVWKGGDCVQTITHPTTSVWSVCALPNGDIVTGSSDGIIRVFTASEERAASSQDLTAFEEQVSSSQIPTQVGAIDSDKLHGSEALLAPGKKDGDARMIKVGTSVEAHQWSAAEQRWSKVGEVVGANSGSSAAGGRTLHEGKEYDFVFTVDIAEGQPPLQLPYNMTEDPWAAAQKFITKHALEQTYLTQIHDFIVENSQSVSMSQQSTSTSYRDPFTGAASYVPGSSPMDTSSGGGYSDPFTGGGRYVPPSGGTSTSGQSASVPSQGVDPFTGGGSYRPADAASQPATNAYFPLGTVLSFNNIKPDAAIRKLKELNKQLERDVQCVEGDLDVMAELCSVETSPTAPMLSYLWRLLQWPTDKIFPSLDILRVVIRNAAANEHFCNSEKGPGFLTYLAQFLDTEQSPINQRLALRIISNMASQQHGRDLLLANIETIIPAVEVLLTNRDSNVEVGLSTVLMNIAVMLKSTDDAESKSYVLSALVKTAEEVVDNEARFRICVALGTLVWRDESCTAMVQSMNGNVVLEKWKAGSGLSKLQECAKYICDLL